MKIRGTFRGYPRPEEVSRVPLQQALRPLQTAYRNFFEKRTGYPTVRRKEGKQSAEYTRSAFRFPSTRLCSQCGALHDMPLGPLGNEQMICACGSDRNAARNLLAAGQAVTARGDSVRPIHPAG